MIVLENASKTYRMGETSVAALCGVSLHIKTGEFVSLIGASGSGKSTLLHMIGLLDRPDTGTLRIQGHAIAELPDDEVARLRSETIGFVFQQFHLLKRLTALENVELPLIYAKGSQPYSRPGDLLERVGLGHRETHKPSELSGGQQQRVAIARALVRRPSIVLADEPTGNLDSHSGAEIMHLLRELHAEGLTVILVTHEPSIAAQANRIVRMHDGEIVEDTRKTGIETAIAVSSQRSLAKMPAASRAPWHLFWLSLQQAARSLWSNKLRTSLSAVGIVMGIAAAIVVLALGHAAEAAVRLELSSLGSNRLVISPNPQNTDGVRKKAGAVSRLTLPEALGIEGRIPTVAAVSGAVSGTAQAVYGHNNISTQIKGGMPGYEFIFSAIPAFGRFFTLEECRERARVAILGAVVLSGLFDGANPIGQTIQINHVPFTVIGVLPPKGASGGDDRDNMILMPLQTAMYRVLGKKYVDWIDVSATSLDQVGNTQKKLLDLTQQWPHIPGVQNDSYRVANLVEIAETTGMVTHILSFMLAGMATIALAVGGVGIMNIMLVSVTERTREIGLRKALGARGRDIQTQFLIESVALCLGGGLMGIVLGWMISLTIGYFQGSVMNPTFFSIVLSCGFSVGVGVTFGYWPALQASRLDPIEALRYE